MNYSTLDNDYVSANEFYLPSVPLSEDISIKREHRSNIEPIYGHSVDQREISIYTQLLARSTSLSAQHIHTQTTYQAFFDMLQESLSHYGFSEHIEYVDVLGGLVVDSYHGIDRITCIVSFESIQVLSYINDAIASEEFLSNNEGSVQAIEYLRTLLE